jgi:signal transduction histidine kinase
MQTSSEAWRERSPIDRWRSLLDAALIVAIVAIGWTAMAAAHTDAGIKAARLTPATAAVALAAVLPIVWRRRWPLAMLGVSLLAAFVCAAIDPRGLFGAQVAALGVVLLFAVGAWSMHRWWAGAVVLTLLIVTVAGARHDGTPTTGSIALACAVIGLPVVLGYAARTRRQYVAEVEARLAAAERDRDERARLAVAEERQRLARELHDVVAHHVSLIGVQAGAARTALARSPDHAAAALSEIEASSRSAVGELRQLLDVLAPVDATAPPAPGLSVLPALVDRWRAAGMHVDAHLVGDPATVAPTVSLCCYRLVEEALTNVSRHSTAGRAEVHVTIGSTIAVEILDPGPARSSSADRSGGRGLLGMRERVALCRGTLDVGPRIDGGFRVAATIAAVPG